MDVVGDLASGVGDPFNHDDMFEGRMVCDMERWFFLGVMKYDLNQRGQFPKASVLVETTRTIGEMILLKSLS